MRALDSRRWCLIVSHMAYQSDKANARAQELRKRDTVAEQKLWAALRGRRLSSIKFVRQLPIGPYFVDFACCEKKLIIEVDGVTHGDAREIAYDIGRTNYLREQGWRVIRCWNQDVFENLDGVCEMILLALERD